jgi:CDP-glycerol:poly(glycerophosphate) glycerophosphotransferase
MSVGPARRVRRTGGRLIRQWGLLPEGDPDGLGDDEALRGTSVPFTVMVYFPDVLRNIYQLRQWYGPLRQLDRRHRVGIVCLDSRVAAVVRSECDLPVVCCGRIGTLEDMVSRSDVALALYVNHNVRNLHPLRFVTMVHAYLGHGESDKVASASNQVKAYDFALVAGEAGRERLRRNLLRYDADTHVRTIGRPQLDVDWAPAPTEGAGPGPSTRGRPTVLYAPTWEGAQPSMAYSSVVSHGPTLLRSLLDSGRFDVVYRPHPRTGANRADYAVTDRRLRELVLQHQRSDPDGRYEVDLSPTWDARHEPADVLVSDISAMASDWMTTGKPLVVTVPAAPEAYLDADTVLSAVPGLAAADAATAADLIGQELAGGDAQRRESWVRHTMGDVTRGAAMAQFLAVCDDLVTLRDQELRARAARLTGHPL